MHELKYSSTYICESHLEKNVLSVSCISIMGIYNKICEGFQSLRFYNGGPWENIFRSTQYICLANDTAQSYFLLGRVDLFWIFFSLFRDVSDIHRFPTVDVVNTHFLLEICSVNIRAILRYTVKSPNIKYNWTVLFLSQRYWLFMYPSTQFVIDVYCKTSIRKLVKP